MSTKGVPTNWLVIAGMDNLMRPSMTFMMKTF
jgi:hypothetical protein